MALELSSKGFAQGQPIPAHYTGDGSDLSPPLAWRDPPEGTVSFALICDDPDAPRGTFTHWLLFNLPAQVRELSEGIPAEGTLPNGAAQGKNDFGKAGYGGPAPPPGKPHRYYFKLFALGKRLDLKPGTTKAQLQKAMEGHILAEATLMGTYGRS
jgi:Raf kinase inhibitor-like YbhB/YbcL family protein